MQLFHRRTNSQHDLVILGFDVSRDVQVVIVGGDFIERDDAGDASDVLVFPIPLVNPLDVLRQQFILRPASFEFLRRVEDEHFFLPVLFLALTENENARRQSCAVK